MASSSRTTPSSSPSPPLVTHQLSASGYSEYPTEPDTPAPSFTDQLEPALGYFSGHGDAMTPHVHYSEPPISAITGLAVPPFLPGDTHPPFFITCTSTRRCLRCRPHGDGIPHIFQQKHHVSIKYDVRVDDFRYEYWTWDDLQIAVRRFMALHHLPAFQLRYEGSRNGDFQVEMYRPSGLRMVSFPDDEEADTVEEAVEDGTKNGAALNNTAVRAAINNTVVEARIYNKVFKAAVPIWMTKLDRQLRDEWKAAVRKNVRKAHMNKIAAEAAANNTVAEAAANNHGDIPMPLSNIDPRLQGDDRAVVQPPVAEAAADNYGDISMMMPNIDPRLQGEDTTVVQTPADETAVDINTMMMAEFVVSLEPDVATKDGNGDIPMTTSDIDPRLRGEEAAVVQTPVDESAVDISMTTSNIDPQLQGEDAAVVQNPVDETAVDDSDEFTKMMADIEPFEWDVAPMDYNGDVLMPPVDATNNGDNGAPVADTGMDAAAVRNAGDDSAMDGVQHDVTRSNHPDDQTVVDHREDHTTMDGIAGENVVRTADEDVTTGGLQHETGAYQSDDKTAVCDTEDTTMGEGTTEKAVPQKSEDDTAMDGTQDTTVVGGAEGTPAADNTAGRRIVHKRKAEDDLDDVSHRRPTM